MTKIMIIIIALIVLAGFMVLCKGKGMSINDDDLQMKYLKERGNK